ncbi:MAG TPA: response regulator [Candidatus Dormibacteraeota bacterium]|nr:response regulator [Candidatus Dormibacteraeota bacterium]
MKNRILIVDDDEASLLLLKTYLSEVSDEVYGLSDSQQVESVFTQFEPDLVLLDLHMRDPDGLEVLRRLRSARESLGYLPVLVVTGEMARTSRISALILGADDFITKPYDRAELVLRVRNLLRTRQAYVEKGQMQERPRQPGPET